MGHVIKEP